MSIMHHIVFTRKFPDRLVRHILFWIGQICFWAFLNANVFNDLSTSESFGGDLRLHSYFLPDIFYTYFVTYFLARRYLARNRTGEFLVGLMTVTALTHIFFLFMRFYDYNMFNASRDMQIHLSWMYTLKFMNLGPPVVCAMFLSLKFLKQYHLKTEERKKLVAENNRSQLGLLKAQIHPHFLFNTLSNIHSFALTDSAVAADLVSKLSDTMRYMIRDCEAPYVELAKEMKMIQDYMALESVRYTNALNINFNISGDCSNKLITPLFLIPLIENAYKHGTSQVLSDPWIDIRLIINVSSLKMIISNSKPAPARQILGPDTYPVARPATISQGLAGFRSGIGINNVRKRLELVFPDQHRFLITDDDTGFTAEIELPVKTVVQGENKEPGDEEVLKPYIYQRALSEVQ